MVSSYGPHFGEEAPLVGRYGSGTIFFTFCNLRCVFCQNHDISQGVRPGPAAPGLPAARLATIMLALQEQGCHNINFVTPEHVVPQVLEALALAVEAGSAGYLGWVAAEVTSAEPDGAPAEPGGASPRGGAPG